jgi:hypothetical protein
MASAKEPHGEAVLWWDLLVHIPEKSAQAPSIVILLALHNDPGCIEKFVDNAECPRSLHII